MNAHNKTTQPVVADVVWFGKIIACLLSNGMASSERVNNFSVMEKNEVIRTI